MAKASAIHNGFMRTGAIIWVSASLFAASPAMAVCSGASLDQEYREADVVVRVRVVAETRVADDEPSAAYRARYGEYSPVVLNRLRVLQLFKGAPGPTIAMFQEVASGRFDVDLGHEYLLFLHYHRPFPRPSAARGAMYVKYACGHSRPWNRVERQEIGRLRLLSQRR